MTKNPNTQILIGALNLLAISGPAHAAVAPVATTEQKIQALNTASLKSIESGWLKVPVICKARGFNANPESLENKQVTRQIQSIYSSFVV